MLLGTVGVLVVCRLALAALLAASVIAAKKPSSCWAKSVVAEPFEPISTPAISSGAPVARFQTTDW
jgi:hypothetical protein